MRWYCKATSQIKSILSPLAEDPWAPKLGKVLT